MASSGRFAWNVWWPLMLVASLLFSASARGQGTPAEGAPPEAPPPEAPAPAAPSPEQADVEKRKEDAKQHFFRGIEHVQNEDWDAALAEFLRSRELYPGIASLKNAAIALRQLKRYAESLEMYEELLREFGQSLRPEEKKTAEEAIAKLQKSVGELMVKSDQAGSTVVIDGQGRGTTPLPKPVRVNAGTHSIRVFKEGFAPFETQMLVAGQQRKVIDAKLKALTSSGRLRVVETSGKKLQVVVDGAVVGETPWEGTLSVGTHTVFLKGEDDLGTPPSAATVFANQTSRLTLKAAKLDAELRIEPTPSNARVDIDGVKVGNGVWEGRLKSGTHKIEVTAKGFLAHRRDLQVKSGQREVVTVALERDLSDPMWREAYFVPHVYVEALGGPGLSPSFGGSADRACSRGECSTRSRPVGFMAGARGGYQATSGLGLELFLGYLQMEESMTRSVQARSDVDLTSEDYIDTTEFAGAVVAGSASYQFFRDTPLLFRVWAGAARVRASYKNGGTFSGTVVSPKLTPSERWQFTEELSIPEKSENLWLPLIGPEVRFGYRFSDAIAVDIGVAGFLMFPPSALRRDGGSDEDARKGALTDYDSVFLDVDGNLGMARPGLAKLEKEEGFDTMFIILPTIGLRLDL